LRRGGGRSWRAPHATTQPVYLYGFPLAYSRKYASLACASHTFRTSTLFKALPAAPHAARPLARREAGSDAAVTSWRSTDPWTRRARTRSTELHPRHAAPCSCKVSQRATSASAAAGRAAGPVASAPFPVWTRTNRTAGHASGHTDGQSGQRPPVQCLSCANRHVRARVGLGGDRGVHLVLVDALLDLREADRVGRAHVDQLRVLPARGPDLRVGDFSIPISYRRGVLAGSRARGGDQAPFSASVKGCLTPSPDPKLASPCFASGPFVRIFLEGLET
jgi:hypothetical protein